MDRDKLVRARASAAIHQLSAPRVLITAAAAVAECVARYVKADVGNSIKFKETYTHIHIGSQRASARHSGHCAAKPGERAEAGQRTNE